MVAHRLAWLIAGQRCFGQGSQGLMMAVHEIKRLSFLAACSPLFLLFLRTLAVLCF